MRAISSISWQVLSPYLDEALEMPSEQRSRWVASLRAENPELAHQLETLLREHVTLAQAGFLENGSVGRPTLAGQTVGVYTLISQIGQGGMGSVWLAERNDGRFDRRVAIKFLNLALIGKAGEHRFKREGNILSRLADPHIAELLDAGISQAGQPYLILEYIEGDHIDRYCDQRRLSVGARLRIFLEVLGAVSHAHANLIVHRDLKPSNVLVGNDSKVKLLDFGIAKLLEGESKPAPPTRLTMEGGRAMTPEYAAPEQLKGEAVTTATDVYALGVLLYMLLTGQHPAGPGPHTAADLIKAVVEREPVRPSDIVTRARWQANRQPVRMPRNAAALPTGFIACCLETSTRLSAKALKNEPGERYASVTALADDLRRFLKNEPISARPETFAYRGAKFVRRNRTAVALATLAVAATVGGVTGTLVQTRTARAQRDFALRQVERSEALKDFHEFLLSDAAPSGKPFTVNDLLARAEHIVERQHADDDPTRVMLMTSIGRQYLAQDEGASARRVLELAYILSRSVSDRSIRAQASCTLAAQLARDEQLQRAEQLYQEGLLELPEDPQFALARIDCLQSGSEIAQETGAIREGIARSLSAQRVLERSPFRSDTLELNRWTDLAKSYSSAGQDAEAVSAFERAGALLTSLGRDDTGTAVSLFNNWALELDQIGHPLEAQKMYRRAIDISSAGHSEDAVSPMVLCNYARCLRLWAASTRQPIMQNVHTRKHNRLALK